MACLFNPKRREQSSSRKCQDNHLPEHALYPRNDLMTGRIRRFVEIDHARTDILLELTLERGASYRYWREMACAYEKLVVVFEEERPVAGVYDRAYVLRFDCIVLLILLLGDCQVSHYQKLKPQWPGCAFQNSVVTSGGKLKELRLSKIWCDQNFALSD